MDVKTAQQLFAEAGYYRAVVDGLIGPATMAAVLRIESNAGDKRGLLWNTPRRVIAAAQRVLAAQGHYRVDVDGLSGPATQRAIQSWREKNEAAAPVPSLPTAPRSWPKRRETAAMNAVFGKPGGPKASAGKCELPFPFVVAWDLDRKIRTFACNLEAQDTFKAIFAQAAQHYGEMRFRELRLDRYGGCYEDRSMRGSTATSTHAWGVAVDIDPERNQLRWDKKRAKLALPEYEPFWKIVEAHGAVSLGRTRNYDFMHFQLCRE